MEGNGNIKDTDHNKKDNNIISNNNDNNNDLTLQFQTIYSKC